jgi:hypothetical protein
VCLSHSHSPSLFLTLFHSLSQIDAAAMIEDGLFVPDWVLDVESLEQSQVWNPTLLKCGCVDVEVWMWRA